MSTPACLPIREFAYSREIISGFMLVLQNALSGFLLAFAAVLLLAVLVVLGHQIQSTLRQDAVSLEILKTLGKTSAGLASKVAVTAFCFGCGWLACGKLKRLSMAILASE